MNKPIKWTLIGLGIFILVAVVAVIIIFLGMCISAGVITFKETFTPETKQVEQVEEEVATEEIEKLEDEKTTGSQGISEELETGQEFIYNGRKIVLTKYDITPTHIDKNLLWVYLYVENIDNVAHSHIYGDMDFIIYHKEREDGYLGSIAGMGEGRKMYETGPYHELSPGEVCEGWIGTYIPTDWNAENIEIHFEPGFGPYTPCIWKLIISEY